MKKIPNTFGIEATADEFICIADESSLVALLASGRLKERPYMIVGAASNIVFTRPFDGTVLHMDNRGIEYLGECDDGSLLVRAAAGENWDGFVRHCASHGWHGLENLAAIPGTVGAAPVQNVGAYGSEAKDVVAEVTAYDIAEGKRRLFSASDCQFAYRDSLFKHHPGRYIVTDVTFRLSPHFSPKTEYKALADALSSKGITQPSAEQTIETLTELRWSKLPRPEETGSAGSFFKNPVVGETQYKELAARYPDIVAHRTAEGYKLAAGWLIEHAGWKGRDMGRCGVYDKQALVLVNLGGCTGKEVVTLAHAIVCDIKEKYGVELTPEAIIV